MAIAAGRCRRFWALYSRGRSSTFTRFSAADQVQWDLAVSLNRIIFPSIFFMGLAAVAAAILNSFHVFAIPAATSIFFNLSVHRVLVRRRVPADAALVSGRACERRPWRWPSGFWWAAFLQLAIQIPALVRRGMKFFLRGVSVTDPGVRQFGRLMGPSFFGMGVYQINLFVDTIFATSSRMPSGSITSLYVADRVMQLVLGSYAIAMSTAILPTMSHQLAAGKLDEMKHTFGFALRIVSFITIPAAVGLILLRQPIIQVLFQHGRFVAESTSLTANALLYYSLGLPAFAAIKLITPMYYSAQDTMTPARIGAYALARNIVLNAAFLLFAFRYLSNGSPALASSLAAISILCCCLCFFASATGGWARGPGRIARQDGGLRGGDGGRVVRGSEVFEISRKFATLSAQAGLLAAMIGASVAVYFGLAWLLRCEELAGVSCCCCGAPSRARRRSAEVGHSGIASFVGRQGSGSAHSARF